MLQSYKKKVLAVRLGYQNMSLCLCNRLHDVHAVVMLASDLGDHVVGFWDTRMDDEEQAANMK